MTDQAHKPPSPIVYEDAKRQNTGAARRITGNKMMLERIAKRRARNPEHPAYEQLPAAQELHDHARHLLAQSRKGYEAIERAHREQNPMPADDQLRHEAATKAAQAAAWKAHGAIDTIYTATKPPTKGAT